MASSTFRVAVLPYLLRPRRKPLSVIPQPPQRRMSNGNLENHHPDAPSAKKPRRASPTPSDSSSNMSQTTVVASPPAEAGRPIAAAASSFLVQRDADHPAAKLPTRGSAEAAGYDLYASETITIPKNGRKVVQTGIRMKIPDGCYGRVAPRSGLAVKHGIDVGAGVVDSDYRGLLGILLFNFGDEDFTVNSGDRIAQMVLERIATPEVTEVQSLEKTIRGEGGFGHTGGFGAKTAAQ